MDVRKEGKQIPLTIGKWYVGMNWLYNLEDDGAGALAQYQGDGEFYDEDGQTLVKLQDYEYLIEQL